MSSAKKWRQRHLGGLLEGLSAGAVIIFLKLPVWHVPSIRDLRTAYGKTNQRPHY